MENEDEIIRILTNAETDDDVADVMEMRSMALKLLDWLRENCPREDLLVSMLIGTARIIHYQSDPAISFETTILKYVSKCIEIKNHFADEDIRMI